MMLVVLHGLQFRFLFCEFEINRLELYHARISSLNRQNEAKLTRIGLLNHTNVVASITNGTRSFTGMLLDQ